jgi:hypothetical protein
MDALQNVKQRTTGGVAKDRLKMGITDALHPTQDVTPNAGIKGEVAGLNAFQATESP